MEPRSPFTFYKYQGTGNDFVIIDARTAMPFAATDVETIAHLCDRRFGIGADGLILLRQAAGYDFEMLYFNADGRPSSMCGNGGRCITAFAKMLGIFQDSCRFLAVDGPHEAKVRADGWVELKMGEVSAVEKGEDFFFLDTGSPHYVTFVEDLDDIDVPDLGSTIRYSEPYAKAGTNVNFVEVQQNTLLVGTYERGVEDETLSCGTGVTAAAIAHVVKHQKVGAQVVPIQTKGGALEVRLEIGTEGFHSIWLCGPASLVFEGSVGVN
ncbi:MAG: diaminopimelate epimerase [Bacteroidota bacterium]